MVYESDESLVRDFAEFGGGRAMETLFRRHLPRVHAIAFRYLRIREDAEEAASEALLRAFRALRSRQFRGEASFRTWTAKIVVNVCLERIRQPRLPTLAFDDIGEMAASVRTPLTDIDEAIAQLPDQQRLVLILCDLEGCSAQEAASVIGKSLTATKSLHYRARQAVRELLDDPDRE